MLTQAYVQTDSQSDIETNGKATYTDKHSKRRAYI